jgi:hypothetical protein
MTELSKLLRITRLARFEDFLPEVKGKSVNWNSKAAEAVATKATTIINDKIESQIR